MKPFKILLSILLLLICVLEVRSNSLGTDTVFLNRTQINLCAAGLQDTVKVTNYEVFSVFLWQIDSVVGEATWIEAYSFNSTLFPDDKSSYLIIPADTSLNNHKIRCLAFPPLPATGSDTSAEVTIRIYEPILDKGTIFGDSLICMQVTSVLHDSVSSVTNATYYHWTLYPAWDTIIPNYPDSSSITISGSTTSSSLLTVTPRNAGCAGPSSQKTISVVGLIVTGSISGPDNMCQGIETTYTAAGCKNATKYYWTVPSWAIITSVHDSIINLIANENVSDSIISVVPSNHCFTGDKTSKTISVYDKLTSGVIGPDTAICIHNSPGELGFSIPPMGSDGIFQYQWQNSVDNKKWDTLQGFTDVNYVPGVLDSPRYYRVLVRADLCSETATTNVLKVNVNPSPEPAIISGSSTVCRNQHHTMYEVETVPGYVYSWSLGRGLGLFEAGQGTNRTYIHWGNDSNIDTLYLKQTIYTTQCSEKLYVLITILNKRAPDTTIIIRKTGSNMLVCADTSEGIKYQWGFNPLNPDTAIYIGGATSRYVNLSQFYTTYNYFVDTYYEILGTCTTRSYMKPYSLPIGYDEYDFTEHFPVIFPNPTSGVVTIILPDFYSKSDIKFRLYDLSGRLQFNTTVNASKIHTLALPPGLKQGLYILQLVSATNPVFNTRLTIVK